MSKITKLGVIGQIVSVIGLAAGLAACNDPSSSASTAASTASSATAPSSSIAATTPTSGESKTVSGGSSTSSQPQSITLAWDAPTQNTDGSALTNLQGYQILYGTSAAALTQKISISTTGQQNYVVENLTSGTWYFEVRSPSTPPVSRAAPGHVSVTLS